MSAQGRMRVSTRDLSHVLRSVAKCRALEKPGSPFAHWAVRFTDRLRKFLRSSGKPVDELEWELAADDKPQPSSRDE